MGNITQVAKAQIYIGAATYPTSPQSPPTLTTFTGDTYTPIRNTSSIGDFGDTAEEIKLNLIDADRVVKLKGQRDAGDFSLECAFDPTDPGQMAVMAANASDANFNFKVVLNDPATAGGTGYTTYFQGLVTSAQTKMGAANAAVSLMIKIAINSAPLAVAAS